MRMILLIQAPKKSPVLLETAISQDRFGEAALTRSQDSRWKAEIGASISTVPYFYYIALVPYT